MPIREMTPEEKAEFDRKHPLGTMLIMRARQTPLAKTQASESSAPKPLNPYVTPPSGKPSKNLPPSLGGHRGVRIKDDAGNHERKVVGYA